MHGKAKHLSRDSEDGKVRQYQEVAKLGSNKVWPWAFEQSKQEAIISLNISLTFSSYNVSHNAAGISKNDLKTKIILQLQSRQHS